MRSIDNVPAAVTQALNEKLDLSHLVVTAWRAPIAKALAAEATHALAVRNSEVELDDLIPGALVGSVVDIIAAASYDNRPLIDTFDLREVEEEFTALIARASKTTDAKFLRQARLKVR